MHQISAQVKQQTNIELQFKCIKSKQYRKINYNGFSSPFTIWQILPIVYSIISVIAFVGNLVKTLGDKVYVIVLVCFILGVMYIFILRYWYKTTAIDPTDEIQIIHRECKQKKMEFNIEKYKYYCKICETCIGNNTYHCRKCNRCVNFFDHHCRWLNNCIGSNNYIQFLLLIFGCEIQQIFKIGVGMYLFVDNLKCVDNGNYEVNWMMVFNAVMMFLSIVPLIFLSFLCSLHIYLYINKKSTIDLIIQNRKINKIYPSKQKNKRQSIINKKINKQSLGIYTNDNGITPNILLKQNSNEKQQEDNNQINFIKLQNGNIYQNQFNQQQLKFGRKCKKKQGNVVLGNQIGRNQGISLQ